MSNDEKTVQETKKSWFNTALFFGALAPAVFASTLNFAEGVTRSSSRLGRATSNFLSNTWVAASVSVIGTLGLMDIAKRAKSPLSENNDVATSNVAAVPEKESAGQPDRCVSSPNYWRDTVNKSNGLETEMPNR